MSFLLNPPDFLTIISGFLFVLVVIGLFFLIFREVVTWYFKLNRIVKLLEKIEENTRKEDDVSNFI